MSDTDLRSVRCAVHAFTGLDRRTPVADANPLRFNQVVAAIHRLSAAILDAESRGASRERILEAVAPARAIHRRSPLAARLQDWPRGYPGDFETIEYLYTGRNRATDDTSYYIERYALSSPIAQQHRNKLLAQASLIEETLAIGRSRILVLACGGAIDLCLALRRAAARGADAPSRIWLNDADPDALRHSQASLGSHGLACTFVPGHAIQVLRQLRDESFDLIVAGGLFDYLPMRHCRTITRLAMDRLTPGGRFFFTNIAAGNPYRTWIEYCSNWRLIERSEACVMELVVEASDAAQRCAVAVEKDATGLALLATVTPRAD